MLKQMELALAYGCPDSVDSETLVEYIHHNRDLNARQINTLGNALMIYKCLLRANKIMEQVKTLRGSRQR